MPDPQTPPERPSPAVTPPAVPDTAPTVPEAATTPPEPYPYNRAQRRAAAQAWNRNRRRLARARRRG